MSTGNISMKVLKYISKTENVLRDLKIADKIPSIEMRSVIEIIDEAKRYFEDAKYYFERKDYAVSLASIAYCEGLLDALRMLGLVKFNW